jgi:hypothetical protein
LLDFLINAFHFSSQFGAPAVVREEFPPVITCIQCFSFIPVWSTSCGTGGVPPGHTMYSIVYDDHCGISYTYPIFPCRTTDWIDCCRADFAVYMFLGGTILRLHQQTILSWCLVGTASTLGAVSSAVGAALLIPIIPGNLQVW